MAFIIAGRGSGRHPLSFTVAGFTPAALGVSGGPAVALAVADGVLLTEAFDRGAKFLDVRKIMHQTGSDGADYDFDGKQWIREDLRADFRDDGVNRPRQQDFAAPPEIERELNAKASAEAVSQAIGKADPRDPFVQPANENDPSHLRARDWIRDAETGRWSRTVADEVDRNDAPLWKTEPEVALPARHRGSGCTTARLRRVIVQWNWKRRANAWRLCWSSTSSSWPRPSPMNCRPQSNAIGRNCGKPTRTQRINEAVSKHNGNPAPVIERTQEQAQALGAYSFEDKAMFARVRGGTPDHISDEHVGADVLEARKNGIDANNISQVSMVGDNIRIARSGPDDKAILVGVNAPEPYLQTSIEATNTVNQEQTLAKQQALLQEQRRTRSPMG